jgi:glycosyltransferase involved in cell wall biosynthesis
VKWAAVRVSREFSNSVDHVIAPTEAVADVLRGYGVHRPIAVIPTGIDLDLVRSTDRRPAREGIGVPADVPLIAYSGRIALEKSLDVLVQAFALTAEQQPEAHLVLIGGGPWESICRALAESLGVADRVHFTGGFVDRQRVFDYLAEADVFAFASLTDTQGVAVLEAMAVGCPPVVVESGAVADVVRDGVDGLVVAPSAEALADGLTRLLESDDMRHRLAGLAEARAEEFSAGRMAERLTRVYEELL